MRVLSLTDEADDPLAVEPLFVVRCSPTLLRSVLRLVESELNADALGPEPDDSSRVRSPRGARPQLVPVPDP
jgi:hypothetical protein